MLRADMLVHRQEWSRRNNALRRFSGKVVYLKTFLNERGDSG